MPMKTFDYGNALNQAENIKSGRIRNALNQKALDPNSLENQIKRQQYQRGQQQFNIAQSQENRARQQFQNQQKIDELKMLNAASAEIMENPQAVEKYDFKAFEVPPEQLQNRANTVYRATTKALQALSSTGYKPTSQTSDIQNYEYRSRLGPEQQEVFDRVQRSEKSLIKADMGDRYDFLHPVTGQVIRSESKSLAPKDQPENIKAGAAAQVEGKKAGEKSVNLPKAERQLSTATSKTQMLDELITQASNQAGFWSTGFMGQKLEGLGGTQAHDLQQTLATIKANIGFDRLQEMRDSSPTGGALGQVSEQENRLLQAVWGALEQSQSAGQFKQNLERVRKQVKESWARVAKAYEQDYGQPYDETESQGTGLSQYTTEQLQQMLNDL